MHLLVASQYPTYCWINTMSRKRIKFRFWIKYRVCACDHHDHQWILFYVIHITRLVWFSQWDQKWFNVCPVLMYTHLVSSFFLLCKGCVCSNVYIPVTKLELLCKTSEDLTDNHFFISLHSKRLLPVFRCFCVWTSIEEEIPKPLQLCTAIVIIPLMC